MPPFSIHNLCPEKGGTDLYVVPYPDEAACCAALDDYFASMALLAGTPYYDVLAHIIYPLRYMEVPVSLEPYYGRIRAILRTAMYEVLYMPDVPNASAIDAAVELTKQYEPQEVASFVNGILGTFVRTELPDEPAGEQAEPEAGGEEVPGGEA